MAKQNLELIAKGTKIGTFKDVKIFQDRFGDGLYVECADGKFNLPVNRTGGWRFEQAGIYFDEYRLVCRDTLIRW